jgi:hypothetical protein
VALYRYAERGELVLIERGQGFNVASKGFPFGVGICSTACREGANKSRNGRHVLTSSLSGKTSLIHSLAGELGLDIYVVSLSSKGCVFRLSPSFPS